MPSSYPAPRDGSRERCAKVVCVPAPRARVCVLGSYERHHAYGVAFAFVRNGLGNIRPLWRAATDPDPNPARRHGSVCVPYCT